MPTFEDAKLILSANSTVVNDIKVKLLDNKCFTVDANSVPSEKNGRVLPTGQYANPFSIVPGTCKAALPPGSRVADLHMNPNAIATWHPYFDSDCVIILTMLLDNSTPVNLNLELFCNQHTGVAMAATFQPTLDG